MLKLLIRRSSAVAERPSNVSYLYLTVYSCPEKKGTDSILAEPLTNLDKIFGTNHRDNPCDRKIVMLIYRGINTFTTLRNDDVIPTYLKNTVFATT